MPPSRVEISKIVALVHPLYSIHHRATYSLPSHQRFSLAAARKNVSFLLGVWGRSLREIKNDPGAVGVMVLPSFYSYSLDRLSPAQQWAREQLMRFRRHLSAELGSRLIVFRGVVPSRLVRGEIARRGFKLSRQWQGRAFGEYWGRCVTTNMALLEKGIRGRKFREAVREDRTSFQRVPELSLSALNAEQFEMNPRVLGTMRGKLRKSAKQRRLVLRA